MKLRIIVEKDGIPYSSQEDEFTIFDTESDVRFYDLPLKLGGKYAIYVTLYRLESPQYSQNDVLEFNAPLIPKPIRILIIVVIAILMLDFLYGFFKGLSE